MFVLQTRTIALFFVVCCVWCPVESIRSFWRGKKFSDGPSQNGSLYKKVNDDHIQTLWFDQILDHNDPTNPTKWKQRFYVNDEHFRNQEQNGPVFLLIGGEGEATINWMHQGAWIHYAKEHGALCFQLEHRFYGKSHPTKDLAVENLQYLTSEQALLDVAYFIEAMNERYNLTERNRWIAFGGSYPGSLAAWVREKFPYLVHGSISTSGPLLAKIDFREYFEVVVNSLKSYSPDCVTNVQTAISQVEILLKHMIGQRNINKMFKLCDPVEESISKNLDISSLFENLAGNFAGVVQYNKDNSPHAKLTIDEICDVMGNKSIGTQVDRLAVVNGMVMKQDGEECLDYVYDKIVQQMHNTSWESDVAKGARQWTFQTCNEFGFYQTSDNPNYVFGDKFPVDYFVKQCADIYGAKYSPSALESAVYRTNTYYGALNPLTTNVLYVHGSIDPWHRLGLTESNDLHIPTIFITGTAHCANMYEPKEDDFPQLKAARQQINSFIGDLLQQHVD